MHMTVIWAWRGGLLVVTLVGDMSRETMVCERFLQDLKSIVSIFNKI